MLSPEVIGGSGAGKSYQYVIPNLLQASGCSYVITDPKGELFNGYGRYLEKQGYKVKVLNIDDMSRSCGYNPFKYIRNDDDVTDMCQTFMENTQADAKKSGDFWDNMSMIQLEALCHLVRATYPEDKQNWFEVSQLLRKAIPEKDENGNPIPTEVDNKFNALNAEHEGHIAYLKWMDFKSIAKNDETVANAVGSTIARITRFSNPSIRKLTSIDTIELEKIGQEKTALFCLTKAANSTYNFIMGMCYMQLFQTLESVARTKGKNNKLPVYTRFLLDEFANICKIPKFDEWLSYIRSFGVSISIIIQTYAQLEALYDKKADVITGNCDFTLFLGSSDEKVCKKISERLGKTTIYRKEHVKGNQYKRVAMQRDLMTTDEILKMTTNECILWNGREKPVFDQKIKTSTLPNWKYVFSSTHDMNDWYDTRDYPHIDEAYERINKEKQKKNDEAKEVLEKAVEENKEVVKTIEQLEAESLPPEKNLTHIIENRTRTIDEERIAALKEINNNNISSSELSDFLKNNFSSNEEVKERTYVISTFKPNFEFEMKDIPLDDFVNDFVSTSKKEEEKPLEEDKNIEIPVEDEFVEPDDIDVEDPTIDDENVEFSDNDFFDFY